MAQPNDFQHFDIVSDDSDHRLLHHLCCNATAAKSNKNIKKTECFANTGSVAYKTIMREWRILAQSLPESIYVRVYEKRIDLMRAAIVGAADTPYHDGLFFFDIAFPPDYPTRPPMVRYQSFGFKLNPNLYGNGYVCLSLVNTWVGKKSEKWDPSGSTVLQLLVSLQGLVLNDKPFFNEAGAEIFGRALFEKKARAYNETVFTLNCRTMLSLLRRPPLNFEGFVGEHFRSRAAAILSACKHYVSGRVRVGWYGAEGGGSCVKVSEEFKASIGRLYPTMVSSFLRSGASFAYCTDLLKLETEMNDCDDGGGSSNKKKRRVGGGRKYGKFFRKVIGKIRKFYVSELKTPSKI